MAARRLHSLATAALLLLFCIMVADACIDSWPPDSIARTALQGWRAMRARATHIAARVRRAFGGAHGRKRGAAAYRPLDGGGGAGNGSRGGRVGGAVTADTEAEAEGPEQLPPRLREVLVGDSLGSASSWGGSFTPRLQQTLLAGESPAGSS